MHQTDQQTQREIHPPAGESIKAYYAEVRSLGREIETAIAAIKSNALSQLQESIARQEMLCGLLAMRADEAQRALKRGNPSTRTELEREIRALGANAATYKALLRRCAKNNAQLMALCESYFGARMPSPTNNAVSCEV